MSYSTSLCVQINNLYLGEQSWPNKGKFCLEWMDALCQTHFLSFEIFMDSMKLLAEPDVQMET